MQSVPHPLRGWELNVVIAQQSLPLRLTTGGKLPDNYIPQGFTGWHNMNHDREQEAQATGRLRLRVIRWTLQNSRKISRIQETSGLVFCFSPLSFISTFLWRLFLSCSFFQHFCFVFFPGELLFVIPTGFLWLYLWSYIYIPLLFYVFLAFILKSLHILSSKKLRLLCPPQESDITFLCALVNADVFRSTFNRTCVLSIEINSVCSPVCCASWLLMFLSFACHLFF